MDLEIISVALVTLGFGYLGAVILGLKQGHSQLKTRVKDNEKAIEHLRDRIKTLNSALDDLVDAMEQNEMERENNSDKVSDNESDGETPDNRKNNTPNPEVSNDNSEDAMNNVIQLLSSATSAIKQQILKANEDDPKQQTTIHELFDLIDNHVQKLSNIDNQGTIGHSEDPQKTSNELLSDARSILNQPDE